MNENVKTVLKKIVILQKETQKWGKGKTSIKAL